MPLALISQGFFKGYIVNFARFLSYESYIDSESLAMEVLELQKSVDKETRSIRKKISTIDDLLDQINFLKSDLNGYIESNEDLLCKLEGDINNAESARLIAISGWIKRSLNNRVDIITGLKNLQGVDPKLFEDQTNLLEEQQADFLDLLDSIHSIRSSDKRLDRMMDEYANS